MKKYSTLLYQNLKRLFDLNDQHITQRMFKGTFFVAFFTLAAAPVGYFIRIILARSLSIEMYGLLYAVLALIGILTTYNDLGFGYALTYLIPKFFKKKRYQKVWSAYIYERNIELVSAIVISIGLILLSPWLADHYFKVPEARWLLIILCLYFIGNCYISAIHKYFMGLRQEQIHVTIQPFILFATFLSAFFFALIGKGNVYFFGLCWAIAYAAASIFYTWINRLKNPLLIKQKVKWEKSLFLEMFHYALPTILQNSVFTLITSMDTFFLTLLRGVAEVGVYNIIVPLAAVPAILFSPLESFLFPYISHFAEGEKDKIEKLLHVSQVVVILVAIYFGTFTALFSGSIVETLFGKQWVELTARPLQIWAFSFVIFGLASHFNTMISGVGKVRERLKVSVVIAISNVLVSGLAIYFWGVMGAVIANIFVNALSLIIYILILRQEIHFRLRYTILLKAVLLSLCLFIGMSALRFQPKGWIQLGASGMFYSFLFAVGILLFGLIPINRQSIQFLRTLLKQKEE